MTTNMTMRTGSGLELVNFPVFPPNNQEFNRKSLLGMPNEVKSMIFYQIEDGVDQVAFQLTCTAIATATSGHRLHQLPVNRHGNNPNRYNILKALGSWGWIPGVKILCRLCAKYSVIRKQWKDSSGKPINQRGFKEYKPTEVYELWRKYHICPSCQFPVVAGRNHLYNAIRPRSDGSLEEIWVERRLPGETETAFQRRMRAERRTVLISGITVKVIKCSARRLDGKTYKVEINKPGSQG